MLYDRQAIVAVMQYTSVFMTVSYSVLYSPLLCFFDVVYNACYRSHLHLSQPLHVALVPGWSPFLC